MQRGQCVLHVAASCGYPALIKAILQLKANVDCRDDVSVPTWYHVHAYSAAMPTINILSQHITACWLGDVDPLQVWQPGNSANSFFAH